MQLFVSNHHQTLRRSMAYINTTSDVHQSRRSDSFRGRDHFSGKIVVSCSSFVFFVENVPPRKHTVSQCLICTQNAMGVFCLLNVDHCQELHMNELDDSCSIIFKACFIYVFIQNSRRVIFLATPFSKIQPYIAL